MLELTPSAAAAFARSRAQNGLGDDIALRISQAESNNGAATAYQLSFASRPSPTDLVLQTAGMRVFVAEEVAEPLQGAVIDAEDTPQGTKLLLTRQD